MQYEVGQLVELAANRVWYPGVVTKVGPKRVEVLYRKGSGVEYRQAVNPAEPFNAGGSLGRLPSRIRPRPVQTSCSGFDHQVAS